MEISFLAAPSLRPLTGGYCEWIKPSTWINTPLYFEIFQLKGSGNWKVALIAESSSNASRLSQLRNAAEFLKKYGWVFPQGGTVNDELAVRPAYETASVYQRNYGKQPDARTAVIKAKEFVLTVLNDSNWEAVFVVK